MQVGADFAHISGAPKGVAQHRAGCPRACPDGAALVANGSYLMLDDGAPRRQHDQRLSPGSSMSAEPRTGAAEPPEPLMGSAQSPMATGPLSRRGRPGGGSDPRGRAEQHFGSAEPPMAAHWAGGAVHADGGAVHGVGAAPPLGSGGGAALWGRRSRALVQQSRPWGGRSCLWGRPWGRRSRPPGRRSRLLGRRGPPWGRRGFRPCGRPPMGFPGRFCLFGGLSPGSEDSFPVRGSCPKRRRPAGRYPSRKCPTRVAGRADGARLLEQLSGNGPTGC